MIDVALLILRIAVGGLLIGHGAQKLFGWFGGPGLTGFSGWLGSMDVRPARLWAAAAGAAELGGGLLIALGALNPLGPLAVISAMVGAMALVHWPNGLWSSNGGIELPLVITAVAAALTATGPGRFSLDATLGLGVPTSVTIAAAALVALGVLSAVLTPRVAQSGSRERA